jgi:hypothetical protein
MPFTMSHAAAVVPLRKIFRSSLPLSALIIGSFSPDFRYFIPVLRLQIFSHSLSAIFVFCLPLSLFVLLIFHTLVKEPLFHLLPESLQRRIEPESLQFSFLPLTQFIAIVIAIILGGFTHIVWDSFTHEHGEAVERWQVLYTTTFQMFGFDVRLYKLLQHTSTVIGLVLLAYWFMKWFRRQPVSQTEDNGYLAESTKMKILALLIFFAIVIGLIVGFWLSARFNGILAFRVFVVQTVVGTITAFAFATFLYSLVFKWQKRML